MRVLSCCCRGTTLKGAETVERCQQSLFVRLLLAYPVRLQSTARRVAAAGEILNGLMALLFLGASPGTKCLSSGRLCRNDSCEESWVEKKRRSTHLSRVGWANYFLLWSNCETPSDAAGVVAAFRGRLQRNGGAAKGGSRAARCSSMVAPC